MQKDKFTLTSLGNSNSLKVIAILAFTIWTAYVLHFKSFGVYEDDYFNIVPSLGKGVSYLLKILEVFITWFLGRPVGFFNLYFLSFIGDKIGGLSGLYLILFIILTINACLFYKILKQNQSELTALTGALAFCLFPVDGAKSLLNNTFACQTSLTFLLIASLCYLVGKKKISYLVSLGSLLSYETAFIVFFGIPLLKNRWERNLVRELIRHATILIGMILVVLVIRRITGEGGEPRVANAMASFFSDNIPLRMMLSPFIGSATSLSMFFRAPYTTVENLGRGNQEIFLICTVCLLIFIGFFSRLRNVQLRERDKDQLSIESKPFRFTENLWSWLQASKGFRLLLTGIVLLGLSYVVVFRFPYYPPNQWTIGRLSTGAHVAAAFGGSVIFASIVSLFFSILDKKKIYVTILLSLYFSLLVGYFVNIQLDFKQSWLNQQLFWRSVIENCPDIKQGTIIIVTEANTLPETKFISTHSWADYLALQNIYQFPNDGPETLAGQYPSLKNSKSKPVLFTVYKLTDDWIKEQLKWNGEQLLWHSPEWSWLYNHGAIILPDSNVILLKMVDGKLVRNYGSLLIKGKEFQLKPKPVETYSWRKGVLFKYLISSGRENRTS